jgi:hypothetical protein
MHRGKKTAQSDRRTSCNHFRHPCDISASWPYYNRSCLKTQEPWSADSENPRMKRAQNGHLERVKREYRFDVDDNTRQKRHDLCI